ncbi:PREDICTED: sperm acrosome-associated protein 5 isoform X2 [Cercocebus atys]|uniref:sperm acrosome-associated protein 5 isoform X2 n=1 Tax=Cercocebus atys TaxID=9531 RepID=UPI0005F46DA8|nr:PREDICTED: sperm acrosome-associated protein 5 isoform X2 [Cercocebus atys]
MGPQRRRREKVVLPVTSLLQARGPRSPCLFASGAASQSGCLLSSAEAGLCMAHYESGFDTAFVDHNPDGSSEYGIFQLNSAWWCDNGITPTKNLCHMDCHDLLNRHILDDIMCAKQIVSSQNGLSAWTSWRRHCSGHDLSEWLKGCDMNVKIDPKIHP